MIRAIKHLVEDLSRGRRQRRFAEGAINKPGSLLFGMLRCELVKSDRTTTRLQIPCEAWRIVGRSQAVLPGAKFDLLNEEAIEIPVCESGRYTHLRVLDDDGKEIALFPLGESSYECVSGDSVNFDAGTIAFQTNTYA